MYCLSAETEVSSPERSLAALRTLSAILKPSLAANRYARSILNGSSEKDEKGSPGVSISLSSSAFLPPKGSISPPSGSIAMALMVKSRRRRSSSIVLPNCTMGFLEPLL